jgi:PAS domain S-box-containing protein
VDAPVKSAADEAARTRELAIANEALRETERESRLIVDCIPGLVAAFTPSGQVEFVNRQVLEYFGRTMEELTRWDTDGTTHPEDLPRVVEVFSHSMASGEPFEFEVRALRFDGVYRWFQSRGFPLRDTDGHIIRWYNLLIDIDERKRAEELLAEEKRFLEMVARGDSMSTILAALCQLVETRARGCCCSVVLVDASGTRLEYGAAPSLPDSFLASMIGRPVNAEAGPSAMAAYLNEPVFSADLTSETRWAAYEWCPMALAHGLQACWATPFTSTAGKVLGAFALYYDEPKTPTSIDQTLIQQLTHIARIAVERAQSDASLMRSEARKAAILDSALDCIVTIDHEGCITEFNPAAERTFGYRRDEVLGRQLADIIIPPALRERHRQGFARYLATGEARLLGQRIEMTAVRADGSAFPAELAITRIPLDGPPSFTGYLRDITERRQSEEELRRSEAFLAQGQSLTLTGSLWWDVSTGEIIWSDETFRVMEVPKSIKPTLELALNRVHPEDLSLVRDMVDRSAREGVNMDFETRLLMPDESVKHVHVVLQNIGQAGKPEFVGAVTDITERKRAEAELRRAYDHLTEAQRLSQTGSFTADLARDEHFWSDEFYRICEFEPGSPVTIQRLGEVVHPEDVALYEGAIGRAMAGTDPDFYFRIVTSRGVKHLRGFAHRIADRPVFVGAVQDVTASKMAQEALNRAGAELAQVSRATTLSALTASIAHEVNQPLSGIITNAGTCLRMLDAAPPDIAGARETARRTIRDGNRASDVITKLRAMFSKRELTLEPLDLNEATREVIALSSNDLQRNRIILQSELADDIPIVTGDRIQLQQVILNLLRNAADAMVDVHDRPRQLLIKTGRESGNCVRVTVRDAGMGLPPQNLDSLFEAFYTTKSGGMGIGLFVSRSIVERHEGRLWAEPNDGPGATFSFSLPFQTA